MLPLLFTSKRSALAILSSSAAMSPVDCYIILYLIYICPLDINPNSDYNKINPNSD